MEGIAHFRRRKCIVLKINKIKTNNDENEKREMFSVNGIQMNLEFGKEVNLLEPVYNALKSNVRTDHYFSTQVNAETGEAKQIDKAVPVFQYNVTELEDWTWPEGHSPYDENGNLIRIDLSKKELENAPLNPLQLKKHAGVLGRVKIDKKEEMATV